MCASLFPAAKDFRPYRDYIGSHIEVMDVATGLRKIPQRPQFIAGAQLDAGQQILIYNAEGLMHTYDLATGRTKQLNTGFAKDNNNDHVLSFDGKTLGISHYTGNHTSTIYTLPVTGSDHPVMITDTVRVILIFTVFRLMENVCFLPVSATKNGTSGRSISIQKKKHS
jgi:TolB protein